VWSTLFNWRDWPSYVYLLIAFVLLFYSPLQVYQLYRKAQIQESILRSIRQGDPDIETILELANSDPTSDWTSDEVLQNPQPADVDYEGVKLLAHSRIYDLRRWHPDEKAEDRRGYVYVRDRITLKLLESYERDGPFVIQFPSRAEDLDFRRKNEGLRRVITRITEPVDFYGQKRTIYEIAYDLSQLPPEEQLTIEVEVLLEFPKTVRAPFVPHAETDVISVWILFPEDQPYRTYSLVSYPSDLSEAPKPMNNRYAIDHPFGSLIGWSTVNPEKDRVYECRWTTE
jgi:hypothetical protein